MQQLKTVAIILSFLLFFYLFSEAVLYFAAVKQIHSPFEQKASKVYSAEEWQTAQEMIKTLNKFGMEAYSIPGTRLYLHKPFSSKLYTINKLRFRGTYPGKKRKREVRIMLIGASNIWGMMAPDNGTIPARIEQQLQQRYPDVKISVLNLGVEAYAFNRMRYLLYYFFNRLQPDMVIFFIGSGDVVFTHLFSTYFQASIFQKTQGETAIKNPIFAAKPQKKWKVLLQKSRVATLVLNQISAHFTSTKSQTETQKEKSIQQAVQHFANGIIFDKRIIEQFLNTKKIPYLFFLSPTASTKSFLTEDEQTLVNAARIALKKPGIERFTPKAYAALLSRPEAQDIVSLVNIFDDYHRSIYFDEVHYNYKGLSIIAAKMTDIISKNKQFQKLVHDKSIGSHP